MDVTRGLAVHPRVVRRARESILDMAKTAILNPDLHLRSEPTFPGRCAAVPLRTQLADQPICLLIVSI